MNDRPIKQLQIGEQERRVKYWLTGRPTYEVGSKNNNAECVRHARKSGHLPEAISSANDSNLSNAFLRGFTWCGRYMLFLEGYQRYYLNSIQSKAFRNKLISHGGIVQLSRKKKSLRNLSNHGEENQLLSGCFLANAKCQRYFIPGQSVCESMTGILVVTHGDPWNRTAIKRETDWGRWLQKPANYLGSLERRFWQYKDGSQMSRMISRWL